MRENNKIQVKSETSDFSLTILCAFRYALGRMTYVTDVIPEFIENNIDDILTKDINIMIKEIDEHRQWERGLGMECDERNWLRLREFLCNELARRNENVEY